MYINQVRAWLEKAGVTQFVSEHELNQFKISFLELRNTFRDSIHHCKIFGV